MTDSDKQKPHDMTKIDKAKERRPYVSPLLVKRDRLGQITASMVIVSGATKSSRALKTFDGQVDAANILAGVAALTVDAWRYKLETGLGQQTHIGPYAEDFLAAFGVGDGVTISTIDAVGVCLAAIRALSEKVETLEVELRSRCSLEAA